MWARAGTFVVGAALSALLVACGWPEVVTVRDDQPQPSPTTPPVTGPATAAVAAVEDWTEQHDAEVVGVAVLDRATGELALGRAAAQPMYSASLSKLIVAVDVLRRDGALVDQRTRDWISRSLGPSDDAAMNELWSRFDGPGAVARVAALAGLEDTRAPQDPGRWGETQLSARDAVRLDAYLFDGLPASERDFAVRGLAAAPPRAADGFDQVFGLAAVSGSAVKSAWMCCQQGRIILHSAGTAGPEHRYAVALLSSRPSSLGYAAARRDLTAAAAAAVAHLR
ncbi:hypothetical protein GCM10011581_37170 [Saccharopolyspora subtropica]|uniref:Beta-lactamase class A n=1 Tax=Saccharopolyspora thermophila TaxID=89367 RepID=A0A917K3P2_9PSEU|nr:hypothetical protein [Saccharopolyspora subtropica]GGI96569.1 hypothetical protein GCM10011581_37170 [Saccharopolyspora subtropica]